MKTKVVALDVYGTILPTIGEQVKRKGLDALLQKCKDKGLTLCTISDANTNDVLSDFKEADLNPEYFEEYFQMERKGKNFSQEPKDLTLMIEHYKKQNISPEEILVIGDRENRDIKPAKDLGCKIILVSEYHTKENNYFDLNNVEVE